MYRELALHFAPYLRRVIKTELSRCDCYLLVCWLATPLRRIGRASQPANREDQTWQSFAGATGKVMVFGSSQSSPVISYRFLHSITSFCLNIKVVCPANSYWLYKVCLQQQMNTIWNLDSITVCHRSTDPGSIISEGSRRAHRIRSNIHLVPFRGRRLS